MLNLSEKLEKYKKKPPAIVFEWHDSITDAKGWVVINSLKNGAAGGGTRMRKGLTKEEVISLAKVMEVKFAVCGPPIGGAKSGIDFDPKDARREDVLKRWYAAVFPLLKSYYGTGGDLNIDELKDVIPITEDLGLWHPQEGIVNGHLRTTKGSKINIIGQLRYGCAKIVENNKLAPKGPKKYAVADLITGYGVCESVRHYFELYKSQNLEGKKAIIQGWGNVASAAGLYLSRNGVKIVGIIDRAGGLICEDGLTLDEVEHLFANKVGNSLESTKMISFEEANDKIWDVNCDIFVPGAASKIVSSDQLARLLHGGCCVVSCGANVPFTDDEVFFGKTADIYDDKMAIIPDFIANCGMARVFAYLMQNDIEVTDEAIFEDVSNTIQNYLKIVQSKGQDGKKITKIALNSAILSI